MAPELHGLWRNVYDRAGRYHRVALTPAFLASLAELPQSGAMLLRRTDGSLAGCAIVLDDGPVLRYFCTGFTEDAARREGVYQRLISEVIRRAIEKRRRAVSFGQSTASPKMEAGAYPVELTAFIWTRSPRRRTFLGTLMGTAMRPEPPVERDVFKQPFVERW